MKLKRKLKKTKISGGREIIPWIERLSYFNQYFPKHTTETEVVYVDNNIVAMRGIVKNEKGDIVSDGVAHKKVSEPFAFQKCQSGALNRALFIFGIYESFEDTIMDEDDAVQLEGVSNNTYNAMLDHLDVDYKYVEQQLPKYRKSFTTDQVTYLVEQIKQRKSAKAVAQASK